MYAPNYWPQNNDPLLLVLQSAAMEETVIWEQHTVTLHRVSVYNSLIPSFLSCLFFLFLSACLWHLILQYVLRVLHFLRSVLCQSISFCSVY